MDDQVKYLIHAEVVAEGVVERSDVVGAIFGQTEGLLGDDLDLRALRRSGRVSRIDVEISSGRGRSTGTVTIATSLEKVETAILAAALETITRVGPCHAEIRVQDIVDVRAATRREVVERAKELIQGGFDETIMSSEEILAEVREFVRVADIVEFEGLPAGPRVRDGDSIIVVEGRSDVLRLLEYGIKNAIALEGTDVPEAIVELCAHRTVTAFLDDDRGGELIFEELVQVADVDYVTFAPSGQSVEELDHEAVFAALRGKVPVEEATAAAAPRDAVAATDGSARPAPEGAMGPADQAVPETETQEASVKPSDEPPAQPEDAPTETAPGAPDPAAGSGDTGEEIGDGTEGAETAVGETVPETLYDQARAVIREGSGTARLLDDGFATVESAAVSDIDDLLAAADGSARTLLLDDVLTQRCLDVAATSGIELVVARELGQFTKRPSGVRVVAIEDLAEHDPAG